MPFFSESSFDSPNLTTLPNSAAYASTSSQNTLTQQSRTGMMKLLLASMMLDDLDDESDEENDQTSRSQRPQAPELRPSYAYSSVPNSSSSQSSVYHGQRKSSAQSQGIKQCGNSGSSESRVSGSSRDNGSSGQSTSSAGSKHSHAHEKDSANGKVHRTHSQTTSGSSETVSSTQADSGNSATGTQGQTNSGTSSVGPTTATSGSTDEGFPINLTSTSATTANLGSGTGDTQITGGEYPTSDSAAAAQAKSYMNSSDNPLPANMANRDEIYAAAKTYGIDPTLYAKLIEGESSDQVGLASDPGDPAQTPGLAQANDEGASFATGDEALNEALAGAKQLRGEINGAVQQGYSGNEALQKALNYYNTGNWTQNWATFDAGEGRSTATYWQYVLQQSLG